jgi:pimeloyl-ACP methyl ester carboxylesterase
MATYVLVHGAWSGAHGFRGVRRLLQAEGHEVFTPSLTGIGERVHLSSPQVDLSTHIGDVVNHLIYEDLNDVVLLGFSYGGFVITGALEHIAERVAHLVYLDAFVPADGQSVLDLTGMKGQRFGLGVEWLLAPRPREFEDPAEATFAIPRRVSHPVGCFSEPVRLAKPLEDFGFPLSYVKATGEPRPDNSDGFWDAYDRARASSAWTTFTVETNHMIPNNRPGELAAILMSLAS